jgi:hypothetical protein
MGVWRVSSNGVRWEKTHLHVTREDYVPRCEYFRTGFPEKREAHMSLLLDLIVSLVRFVLVCIPVVFVLVCILVVLLPSVRYSAALRKLEAACGLVAALAGCLVLAFTLFGPSYSFQSCSGYGNDSSNISSCQTGTANLLQVGIQPITIVAFCILLLGLIGVAVSAVVHSRTGGSGWWRIVLWVSTAVIVILTFLSLFSIGLFLLPSTLFALLASAFSLGARRAALS